MLPTAPLAFRLARRELRGGLKGFRIFLACLLLGVAAIAGVRSLSAGLLEGLERDGRAILGGDAVLRLNYRTATPEQQDWLSRRGTVSVAAEMRALARTPDDARASLVELKAVDSAYPLYGALTLQPDRGQPGGGALEAALARQGDAWGAVVEDLVLERLGVPVGARIRLGDQDFVITGVIAREPDRAGSTSFSLGPRLMIGLDALAATGLSQPGAMVYWNYRIALPAGTDLETWTADLQTRFPDAPWQLRTYTNAAPQVSQFINRMTLFLTLVGLTTLLVGGVGVGNAVRAWLDGRVATIATLKCLGAPGSLIFATYLTQILILAAVGIAAGLVVGAVVPAIAGPILQAYLPVSVPGGIHLDALATAAGFGLLTALAFTLWPLGRAREVAAGALFRDVVAPASGRPRAVYQVATVAAGLALAALAVTTAHNKSLAAWFILGTAVAFLVFHAAGKLVTWGAARVGRPRHPGLRLALANLHRPGNPTAGVVLSLGLGLTVLVAVASIEGNFARRINETMPKDAPAFFFIDIQPDQLDAFRETVLSVPGARGLEAVPMLRGRIARVNGVDAEQALIGPGQAWVLRGDRGITYAAAPRPDTRITAGQWWPADYAGPPLVSVSGDIVKAFGVGLGAELTVNILGRDITARIASIRDVDFSNLAINFTLVFSPGGLERAPQTWLATIRATPEAEPAVQRAVLAHFANVTPVRVKEALDMVSRMLGHIGTAVRVLAAVTLAASTLVLAGAVAAGHRRRVYDAVVLKVLGATRADVLKAFLMEYGLLGLVTAAIAGVLGSVAAWGVLTGVMGWEWVPMPWAILGTAGLCTAITLAFGFVGTWRALGQPSAPLLRND